MQIQPSTYWKNIDSKLEELLFNGYVKLPSIKHFDLDAISQDINLEMGKLTFKELCLAHKKFLENIEMDKYLTPKLFQIAKKVFNYKGDLLNQYHIARKVEPGDSKEMYRAHFDSHLFTVVFPIKIPISYNTGDAGELIYFPKIRKLPNNEFQNFFEKLYYKRFASKKGLKALSLKKKLYKNDFLDYCPLLFLGKITLHTNYPVSKNCMDYRLTFLDHFFDTSNFGIGNILRKIRKR